MKKEKTLINKPTMAEEKLKLIPKEQGQLNQIHRDMIDAIEYLLSDEASCITETAVKGIAALISNHIDQEERKDDYQCDLEMLTDDMSSAVKFSRMVDKISSKQLDLSKEIGDRLGVDFQGHIPDAYSVDETGDLDGIKYD